MRHAATLLCASSDIRHPGVGAHLLGLITQSAASTDDVRVRTSPLLGSFTFDVTDPDFEQVFASKANITQFIAPRID